MKTNDTRAVVLTLRNRDDYEKIEALIGSNDLRPLPNEPGSEWSLHADEKGRITLMFETLEEAHFAKVVLSAFRFLPAGQNGKRS